MKLACKQVFYLKKNGMLEELGLLERFGGALASYKSKQKNEAIK
jgi:hypothetical protein